MTEKTLHVKALPPPALPRRFQRPGLLAFMLYVGAVVFFVISWQGVEVSGSALLAGIPSMIRLVGDMLPPSPARLLPIGLAILETFQMALVGTVIGVLLSLPLAVMASRRHTPNALVYGLARGAVSFMRTVPDLVWAILFVVTVGLGPFAGTLAIAVDTMGFCGRFFAEALEEVETGSQEALQALGARRSGVVFSAAFPAALPSFINTALFSLEKSTRSSVVLGVVGAGGIGIELKVSMDMFQYDQAATIILSIFLLVLAVERVSGMVRRRII